MKIDDVLGADEGQSRDDLSAAIIQRMMATGAAAKLLRTHGLDAVIAAVDDIADFHAGAEELGTSDLSIMVNQVMKNLGSNVAEDSKDDPNHPDTEVANSNPAQAPQGSNPAQVGNAPQAGKMAPTTGTSAGQNNTAAGAAYDAQQNIAGNSTGATAAAQQAAAGAKETVPVLPSDRTAAQQAKLVKAKVQTGALPLSNMSETRVSNEPVIGDIMILELADGRAIHAPIAELRGNSLILALDETAHQWLDEAPDHEHLKIQSSSKVSPVAMAWNSLVDELEADTPEGWAALFRNRALDRESPRKWGRIWRQQHVHLGDELGLDDQRAWEDAVASKLDEMGDSLGEQEDIVRKRLDPKDRAMLAVWMKSHSGVKGKPVKQFAQTMAAKAGHPTDDYWHKIKGLVSEDPAPDVLGLKEAHMMRKWDLDLIEDMGDGYWIVAEDHSDDDVRKTVYEVYHLEDPSGMDDQMATVWRSVDWIRVSPYRVTHSELINGAKAVIAKDQERLQNEAVMNRPNHELDEGVKNWLKILALVGLTGYGASAALDQFSPRNTPLGQALAAEAAKGNTEAAFYLKNLGAYIDASDYGTLRMLNFQYLEEPAAMHKVNEALQGYNTKDPRYDYMKHGRWIIMVSKEPVVMPALTGPNPKYVAKAVLSDDPRKQHIGVAMTQNGAVEAVADLAVDANRASLNPDDYENYVIDFNIDFSREYMDPKTGHFFKFEKGADGKPRLISAGPEWYSKFGTEMDQLGFRRAKDKSGQADPETPTYSFAIGKPMVKALGLIPNMRYSLEFENEDADGNDIFTISRHSRYTGVGTRMMMKTPGFILAASPKNKTDTPPSQYVNDTPGLASAGLGEAQSMLSALKNALAAPVSGSKLDRTIKAHNNAIRYGAKIGDNNPNLMTKLPMGHHYNNKGFIRLGDRPDLDEAKYQGKTVSLGKPIRTSPSEGGKFKVYVRDPKSGNIKMVRFGDTTGLSIKRDDPKRRKNYRARHHCDNPGPRTKANYWSCKMWTAKPVGKILKGK